LSVRIFGVGNPLLCDDGIGVAVSRLIDIPPDATVFQGEIYVEDCLANIEEGDTVIILDAVRFAMPAGNVITIPFEECGQYCPPGAFCHDVSLLHSLVYGNTNVRGFLIGIQAAKIDFHEGLSPVLMDKLPAIVEQVNREVNAICTRSPCSVRVGNRGIGGGSKPSCMRRVK
jgi:hydrogenase maturation protease